MKTNKTKVALVNLISPDFVVRFQAPLAINVLKGYVKKKIPKIEIVKIDMQEIFKTYNETHDEDESFLLTTDSVIKKIISLSKKCNLIVGLSMKWSTKNTASKIIQQVEDAVGKEKILFVVGNIESTYGYRSLLKEELFSDKIAIIGEGENALVDVIKTSMKNAKDFSNNLHYEKAQNVAINKNGVISLGDLVRVDLKEYPNCPIVSEKEIYDEECDFFAIETSRGCPWGKCTFCAVKGQFGLSRDGRKSDWKWRPFPIETILNNIRYFVKQGVRNFDVKDSEFFGPIQKQKGKDPFWESMARAEKFAKGLIRINKKIKQRYSDDSGIVITHVSARVDTVYVEGENKKNERRIKVYKLLKEAGLEAIFLGVESGSKTQIKRYNKGVTVQENEMAINLLRKIGFRVEAGFIMFDPMMSIDEVKENIDFIERTKLYDNDSRILGSLRIQEDSPYLTIAKNNKLLKDRDPDALTYSSVFLCKNISKIERIFNEGEEATKKIIKLLTRELRLESYYMNFIFLKNLVNYHLDGINLNEAVKEFIENGKRYITKIKNNIKNSIFSLKNLNLVHEYIQYALNVYDDLAARYC